MSNQESIETQNIVTLQKMDKPQSLYHPELERDSCGTGFIANLNGVATHQIVEDALSMLMRMEHRGACGCETNSGDGAGILIQTPHIFFKKKMRELGYTLPEFGNYGVGVVFFPSDKTLRNQCRTLLNDYCDELDFDVIGYRLVPTDHELLGETAMSTEPRMEQVFVKPRATPEDRYWLERRLYVLRKYITHEIHKTIPDTKDHFYFSSFSYKTVSYKGQLTTWQLKPYFPDLSDADLVSAIALIHSRFSTNTFPKWKLAQPFRYIAHNGEINTITGNLNWWRSKEKNLESNLFSELELQRLFPICGDALSDSANFDNVLEFLVMNGRSIPHALMMMIPESWQHDTEMSAEKKAFYEYHENFMEPWDGPAGVCFTDGVVVGATLDRNGLRPLRYILTDDNVLITASEAGVLSVPEEKIVLKGSLQPGKILIADLDLHKIIGDEAVKGIICNNFKYQEVVDKGRINLAQLAVSNESLAVSNQQSAVSIDLLVDSSKLITQQQFLFGFTQEDLKVILQPMITNGEEALGSMGSDTPLAILSHQPQHISHYFKQLFAQVTNPPIDPIRERSVMSLHVKLGISQNILNAKTENVPFISLEHPILTIEELEKIKFIDSCSLIVDSAKPTSNNQQLTTNNSFKTAIIDLYFRAEDDQGVLKAALDRICAQTERQIRHGANIIILSQKNIQNENAPVPSLLAVGAVHKHLVETGLRAKASLIVEAGDVWEVHHFATLLGFGAQAICPFMAFNSVQQLAVGFEPLALNNVPLADSSQFKAQSSRLKADCSKLTANYIKAVNKGLLKVMSKIGISTLQSYTGSQIFEILGLNEEVVQKCFPRTVSRLKGLGFDGIAYEILQRYHAVEKNRKQVTGNNGVDNNYSLFPNPYILPAGGVYQWKRRGEAHIFSPQAIHLLQLSTETNDYATFKKFSTLINSQEEQAFTLRGLMSFRRTVSIPLEEVESVETILKRFATGAMSFGSISHEAHCTLAIAMNRIGGRSNSGEGGEDEIRYTPKPNGDWERSAIKQVASGRFGVTSYYLSQANELQIKMAQGAKPGEGGQLPGYKVDEWIGRVRHSTPGVSLISPPPHHDIYSIEDLAQLIFDLKNANEQADVNVKLVSKAGVGIIASGVAKAKADKILISGFDGGTGASPLSSIRHAGLPWELGVAESHQTLVKNKLRDRVVLQTDGQMRTGRDLAIATLLGAEEWGVATAALVVEGCVLMRKCHLNTCPVGIATQNPDLRARFNGKVENVVNYFVFLATELREIMAQLGFRTINEMVGQVQLLKIRSQVQQHQKYRDLDLTAILYKEPADETVGQYKKIGQNHELEDVLDRKLIHAASESIVKKKKMSAQFPISNTDRSVGAMLSHAVSKIQKSEGLPDDSLNFKFTGSAGQSFGCFAARGITFTLEGESNDYLGKGLSGAKIIVVPSPKARFNPSENIILGNVALYGATSGKAFIYGRAGERFAVRNSGATAVVEGVGDHACEYMTGGIVVILGETGKNFGAGMSGGVAYVYDKNKTFAKKFNNDLSDIETPDEEDLYNLHDLIDEYLKNTNSLNAENILDNWSTEKHNFVKVMPREYKKVLAAKKLAMNH